MMLLKDWLDTQDLAVNQALVNSMLYWQVLGEPAVCCEANN